MTASSGTPFRLDERALQASALRAQVLERCRRTLHHDMNNAVQSIHSGLELLAKCIDSPGIARDEYKVLDAEGREIGYVTSGSPAPFLKKNIALAYVPLEFANLGQELKVEIRGQGVKAMVVPTPFYRRPKKTSSQ